MTGVHEERPSTGPFWLVKGLLVGGAPEGTRTPNLLIRSQMLYPLSYGRWHNFAMSR
jgi:hypothetical protein